jgi:hypothetical protein
MLVPELAIPSAVVATSSLVAGLVVPIPTVAFGRMLWMNAFPFVPM